MNVPLPPPEKSVGPDPHEFPGFITYARIRPRKKVLGKSLLMIMTMGRNFQKYGKKGRALSFYSHGFTYLSSTGTALVRLLARGGFIGKSGKLRATCPF